MPPRAWPQSYILRYSAVVLLAAVPAAHGQMGAACSMAMDSATAVVPPEKLPPPEPMQGIGTVQFPISSRNPQAQMWFNQGLNLFDDFWDYESARAFEQAIRLDPKCAICYWGLYEAESFRDTLTKEYAAEALERASALKHGASRQERLYIAAAEAEQSARLEADKSGEEPDSAATVAAWRKAVRAFPHDANARLFLAESLSDGYNDDGSPRDGQKEARTLIQGVLRDEPNNSAAHHFWIHAVEAGHHPEEALHSAEVLSSLAPNSGHMVHMPGHIFYRTGDYARAQAAFDASTAVDERYLKTQAVSVDDDWNYVHNLMYSVANLLEEGRMAEAAAVSAKLSGARGRLEDSLYPWSARDSISRLDPQLPVALRTGDYARVLALLKRRPSAALPNLQFLAESLDEFATGMLSVQSGQMEDAAEQSRRLDAALWRMSQRMNDEAAEKPPKGRAAASHALSLDALPKPLVSTLSIMSLELRATLLIAQNRMSQAEKLFANAQQEETQLGYHEPPSFIRPVGETEAAALLRAHKYPEARAAYRRALEERPNSGFPLYGLAQVDAAAGDAEAALEDYRRFLVAWKNADADLPAVSQARDYVSAHGKALAAR